MVTEVIQEQPDQLDQEDKVDLLDYKGQVDLLVQLVREVILD
jgi:hypothetical protein